MANVNVAKLISDFDTVIQDVGTVCDFTLRSGEQFQLRGVKAGLADEVMTDGLNQGNIKLSVIATRWAAAAPAGRKPEKGDQVRILGHRYAVMTSEPAFMANTMVGYRMRLRG